MDLSSKNAENYALKRNRKPVRPEIKSETVEEMFRYHPSKHITSLTQTILALTNTFDSTVRKLIFNSIKNKNPYEMPLLGNSHFCIEPRP